MTNNTDRQFKELCNEIINNGYDVQSTRAKWKDGTEANTRKITNIIHRYDLSKEFPMLTLRKVPFKSAIDEILWIWQKKSNNVNDLKSHIWDSWADRQGSIGKAYGYQLGAIHDYGTDYMDQVDKLLYDLKNNPNSRRMVINMFIPEDLWEMNLQPCAHSVTFNVTGNKLNAILNQRSQDVLVANGWNVCQYAILVHMLAQVSDLEPGELVHVISDAHIYDRHLPIVKELIKRESYSTPILKLNKGVKNFYDFTVNDFNLEDYTYGEPLGKIEVAI